MKQASRGGGGTGNLIPAVMLGAAKAYYPPPSTPLFWAMPKKIK